MLNEIIVRPAGGDQDNFFLWAMVVLPILSLCAYIFDAFYYYHSVYYATSALYEGLLSTIVVVFSYLQYCAPIKSKRLLFAYHVFLWILVEVGHLGYLLAYIHSNDLFSVLIFVGWMLVDTLFAGGLLYCRVYLGYPHHIEVENKHIFHFISRLEILLAIFMPVFLNQDFSTTTRDNIAFFLLFDFFSEKYEHFSGVWIKSCLYLFATVVTVSIAFEWLYFGFHKSIFHHITDVSELVAAYLCCTLIILQFYAFHFKPSHLHNLVHDMKTTITNPKTTVLA